MADAPTPLGLVLELGDDTPDIGVARMTLSEATASITSHSFYLAPTAKQMAPQAFALASSLAMDVPCYRIDFPRRWDVFPELIRVVEDLAATAAR